MSELRGARAVRPRVGLPAPEEAGNFVHHANGAEADKSGCEVDAPAA
jgi:hypothetical protein